MIVGAVWSAMGLSPRVRGATALTSTFLTPMGLSPRVRGATSIISPSRMRGGLSPRVRGSQHWRADFPIPCRSIPACAGEPGAAVWSLSAPQVYPRVCGGADVRTTYLLH